MLLRLQQLLNFCPSGLEILNHLLPLHPPTIAYYSVRSRYLDGRKSWTFKPSNFEGSEYITKGFSAFWEIARAPAVHLRIKSLPRCVRALINICRWPRSHRVGLSSLSSGKKNCQLDPFRNAPVIKRTPLWVEEIYLITFEGNSWQAGFLRSPFARLSLNANNISVCVVWEFMFLMLSSG